MDRPGEALCSADQAGQTGWARHGAIVFCSKRYQPARANAQILNRLLETQRDTRLCPKARRFLGPCRREKQRLTPWLYANRPWSKSSPSPRRSLQASYKPNTPSPALSRSPKLLNYHDYPPPQRTPRPSGLSKSCAGCVLSRARQAQRRVFIRLVHCSLVTLIDDKSAACSLIDLQQALLAARFGLSRPACFLHQCMHPSLS